MLQEFFALTMTSVYHVVADDGSGHPVAKKIALRDKSKVGVGEILERGTMIAIGEYLLAFIPEAYGWAHPRTGVERNPSLVNTRWWGGNSSSIVALFFEEADAQECLQAGEAFTFDSRWIDSTREVLEAIDEDHPAFVIWRDARSGIQLPDDQATRAS